MNYSNDRLDKDGSYLKYIKISGAISFLICIISIVYQLNTANTMKNSDLFSLYTLMVTIGYLSSFVFMGSAGLALLSKMNDAENE
ncbi:hypothetical protein R4575_16780 [Acinetobacter baumannii]|nr:hypothetical protein [Acinetobacter baumannii]